MVGDGFYLIEADVKDQKDEEETSDGDYFL